MSGGVFPGAHEPPGGPVRALSAGLLHRDRDAAGGGRLQPQGRPGARTGCVDTEQGAPLSTEAELTVARSRISSSSETGAGSDLM